MRIGLFVDLRNPAPWRRPWGEHVAATLSLIADAEAAGIDSVWFSEHHLFDDGYLSQPLAFAAAVAARTNRIRLGTAIVIAPLRDPRHIAEEAAIVDLVSGGRLELGLGAGYAKTEFDAFGADLESRYTRTERTIADVQRLLADGSVTPPPLQDPLPLWAGFQGPVGARRAGRLGVGLLSLDRRLLDPYREALGTAGHDAATARMGGVVNLIVANDPERAAERLLPHYAHQSNSYREAQGHPEPLEQTIATMREALATKGRLPGMEVCTPDDAVASLRRRTEGLPVHHVYLWSSVGGMPDDLVHEHVDLVCRVVRPALSSNAS
jgi:alkanesulfonate monooxygenase SsuD/methylene tetrahydromethanopterin reductase-like flavin-dependent oxidoreductase (luciferase family)